MFNTLSYKTVETLVVFYVIAKKILPKKKCNLNLNLAEGNNKN